MPNENDDIQNDDPLAFVPEDFKGDDGTYDTKGFREKYDEAVSFRAQHEEATAALPKDADGYAWAIPEGHVLPEGFDPEVLRQPVLNKDGSPKIGADGKPEMKDFDISEMIKADDPDLPLLKSAMHKHGAKPELMGEIASILANRELKNVLSQVEKHGAEMKALGPEGKSRIQTVTRTISAMLPPAQASALMDSITSADALRGIEAVIAKSKVPPAAAPGVGKIDNATASIKERLAAGLAARRTA